MGEFDNLVGELSPGDYGWLPLDEAGNPSGPATLAPPPGPNAKACHVYSPPEGDDLLVTATGAPIVPPLNSNIDKRTGDEPADPAPTLGSISPITAECGSADITLTCTGTGFTPNSVIVFNGGEEPTTFVSETELTTGVKPSLVTEPVSVLVTVTDDGNTTYPQTFDFTEPPITRRRK
jgi:hypothetical protein